MSKSNSVVHALALASLGVATGFLAPGLPVMAADGGAGVYLLGKRGPLAAFVPKPGWYLTDDLYFYDAGSSDFLPLGDRLVQKADAEALINIAQFTFVTDATILGGRLAFSGVLPYGRVEVNARGEVGRIR